MKQTTRIALAALVHSLGAACQAFAAEISGTEAEASATPEPPKERKKRGAAAAETPATPAAADPVTPTEPAEETATGGKTYEELRALIDPFVKNGQGPDVKKLIAKYDAESPTPSIKTMPAKNHAAFERDLTALSY